MNSTMHLTSATRIVSTTQHIRIHNIGLHHNTPRHNTTILLTQLHVHSYPEQRTSHRTTSPRQSDDTHIIYFEI